MMITTVSCWTAGVVPARPLVVFRARSRHTYGFEPSHSYDLPLVELSSLMGDSLQLAAADGDDGQAQLDDDDGQAQLFWVQGVPQEKLQAAARRCILVHGAFAVMSSAPSVSEAVASLASTGHRLPARNWRQS